MHYGQIKLADTANGTGMRVSLFVSGCRNHCKQCFQPQTWNFEYGESFTDETLQFLILHLNQSFYEGITILGGEPLEPENQKTVYEIIQAVRKHCPNKSIWLYTGFVYEDIIDPKFKRWTETIPLIFEELDILVDGPFIEEQKNIRLRFRGSENQRIIDMNQTRKQGTVCLRQDLL